MAQFLRVNVAACKVSGLSDLRSSYEWTAECFCRSVLMWEDESVRDAVRDEEMRLLCERRWN